MRWIGEVSVCRVVCLSALIPSSISGFASCPRQPFGVLTHADVVVERSKALSSTLVPSSGEVTTDNELEDDITTDSDTQNGFVETNLIDADPINKSLPPEEDEMVDFVNMIQDTPAGELGREEILVLPSIIEEFIEKNDVHYLQQVLFRKVEEYAVHGEDDDEEIQHALQPTNHEFLSTIKAWIESSEDKTSTGSLENYLPEIVRIFQVQDKLFEDGTESAKPDMETFHVVLRALSTSREQEFTDIAFGIFNDMEFKYNLEPDEESYLYLIRALAKAKDEGSKLYVERSIEKAERLLFEALGRFPPDNMTPLFNEVLLRHAKSKGSSAAQNADELAGKMADSKVKFNLETYNLLMEANGNDQTWDSVCASDRMFNNLLDRYLDGEKDAIEPNIITWTLVMSAWNRLSRTGVKIAVKKTEKMLKRMMDLHAAGRISVKPDSVAMGIVLSCLARHNKPLQAEKLLDDSYERYVNGEESLKPTLRNIKSVLDGWSKLGTVDGMNRAEAILEKYQNIDGFLDDSEVVADVWKTFLLGWTKAHNPQRAHFYLSDMIARGMKPSSGCFEEVILAYTYFIREGKTSFLKNQYAIFSEMEEYRRTSGFQPEERFFAFFVRALITAEVPDLAKKVNVILQRMLDQAEEGKGVKPTLAMYNAVLYACAQSTKEDPQQAFGVALKTFKTFRSRDDNPDQTTFSNFIRCTALLPEGEQRDNFVKSTFGLCAKRGFVGKGIIQALQEFTNEELWRQLTGVESGNEVDVEALPKEWRWRLISRKRKGKSRPKRRS